MLKRAAWIGWSELLERVDGVVPCRLPPAQELALYSEVLPLVRLQRMRRREAWVRLVWECGMPGPQFDVLWRAIRPPRRIVYEWGGG